MARFILDIHEERGITVRDDRARHGRGHGHLRAGHVLDFGKRIAAGTPRRGAQRPRRDPRLPGSRRWRRERQHLSAAADRGAGRHDAARRWRMREKDRGIWREMTWAEYVATCRGVRAGAAPRSGVERGDHVAIIGDNRPEWFIAELAAQSLGAASVGPVSGRRAARDRSTSRARRRRGASSSRTRSRSTRCSRSRLTCRASSTIVYWDPRGCAPTTLPFLVDLRRG